MSFVKQKPWNAMNFLYGPRRGHSGWMASALRNAGEPGCSDKPKQCRSGYRARRSLRHCVTWPHNKGMTSAADAIGEVRDSNLRSLALALEIPVSRELVVASLISKRCRPRASSKAISKRSYTTGQARFRTLPKTRNKGRPISIAPSDCGCFCSFQRAALRSWGSPPCFPTPRQRCMNSRQVWSLTEGFVLQLEATLMWSLTVVSRR